MSTAYHNTRYKHYALLHHFTLLQSWRMDSLKVVYFAETCQSIVATNLHVFDIVHGWFNERMQRKLVVKIFGQTSNKETGQKNMKYN